ncbi:MAG TPA: carboxylating nicotinate-nucleotide diphosphorylase [Bacteroidia bacterium]|jgi:nicotinate-nucleotide pyrophosphorylase (carboxylating)|nr:carboxylating nicotinate-nucleotide diphosphorylase [Bacteroidia bacterium]
MKSYIKKHQANFNFKAFVKQAFAEDVGSGDHTTLATLTKKQNGNMQLLVKEDGILAGVEAARFIFKKVNPKIKFTEKIKDGRHVKKGDVAFTISGPTYQLLTAERLVLNIMQRMSGIATKTHQLQTLCKGTHTRVIDTRKTTPLFRFFEKWAVVIGGGANHRYALYDMILIKDNHIDFAGGIIQAIDAASSYLKKNKLKLAIEVECRNINDVKKVLAHGKVNRILLDNFTPALVKQAVNLIKGKYETEASGGITEKTIRNYALAGVDFISVGALTHHVKSLDLSLKAVK